MKIYERHNPTPLMANPNGQDRGPNGRVLCRWCGTETKPPRRSWCSEACVHEFKVRSHSGYARSQVYKRDRGVCVICSLNCSKFRGRLKRLPRPCRWAWQAALNLPAFYINTLWEVDHIVPVVEGGGSCGLENLRTLCVFCHRKVTRKLRVRLARRRRVKQAKPSSGRLKRSARLGG